MSLKRSKVHRVILHESVPVQKQAALYAILALGIVIFIMLIPRDLESFFLEVNAVEKCL